MRNNASRDEYVPQHGSRYETKGTSSRGLADARIRVTKIAAIGMLTLAVIILENYRQNLRVGANGTLRCVNGTDAKQKGL